MILEILLLVIIIFILTKSFETMTCKDVIIYDSPITSVYDISYNKDMNKFENNQFDKDYSTYKSSLKTYFANLKKYCRI